MHKFFYALTAIFLFAMGGYIWKINNTGYKQSIDTSASPETPLFDDRSVIVEVAGTPITAEDLDWEYKLHTNGVINNSTLTPIPDLGSKYDEELAPLKKNLISSMIERKVLYSFIQQDKAFDLNDPSRYVTCLKQWQDDIGRNSPLLSSSANRDRLKQRLCERSLLDQYMDERLFPGVTANEAEVVEYYKNNFNDFKKAERVMIRQIVLPNEQQAKHARAQVNASNFDSLARQLSIAPEASSGGRLGPFTRGEMPEFFDIAFKMKEGQLSDILKSNYGFHIIMLLQKLPAADLSLAQATPAILQILKKRKQQEEYQKWVERALAQVSVSTPKPLW